VILCSIDAKYAVEVPAYQGRLHTKFEENRISRSKDMTEQTFFIYSFSLSLKKCYNSQIHNLIKLKFGTLVRHPKAIISTNFGVNLYQKVIVDYT